MAHSCFAQCTCQIHSIYGLLVLKTSVCVCVCLHCLFCSGNINKIHSLREKKLNAVLGRAGRQEQDPLPRVPVPEARRASQGRARTLSGERPGPRPQRPLLRSSTLQLRRLALGEMFTP